MTIPTLIISMTVELTLADTELPNFLIATREYFETKGSLGCQQLYHRNTSYPDRTVPLINGLAMATISSRNRGSLKVKDLSESFMFQLNGVNQTDL